MMMMMMMMIVIIVNHLWKGNSYDRHFSPTLRQTDVMAWFGEIMT